jgi:hypothetical protein
MDAQDRFKSWPVAAAVAVAVVAVVATTTGAS